jgi:hypothetical protein
MKQSELNSASASSHNTLKHYGICGTMLNMIKNFNNGIGTLLGFSGSVFTAKLYLLSNTEGECGMRGNLLYVSNFGAHPGNYVMGTGALSQEGRRYDNWNRLPAMIVVILFCKHRFGIPQSNHQLQLHNRFVSQHGQELY